MVAAMPRASWRAVGAPSARSNHWASSDNLKRKGKLGAVSLSLSLFLCAHWVEDPILSFRLWDVQRKAPCPSQRRPGRSSSPRSCRRSSSSFQGPGAGPLYWQQHQNGPGKAALLEHSARGIQGEPSRCLERANVAESRASSALRAPCLRLQLPVHVLVALVPRIHDTREDKEDCSGILPGAQQGFNIKAGLGQVASRRSRHGRREAHRAPRAALGRTGRGHRDTGPRPSQGYCKAARRSRQRRRRLPERWRGTPGPEFQRIWSRSKLGRQSHHRLWNSTWLRGSELRSGRGPRQEHVLLEASQVPFVGRKKRREVLASLLPPPWPLHQEVFPSPTVRPGQLLTSMARSWEHTHHIETTPTTLRADRH